MPVVVKITDQGHVATGIIEPPADLVHRRRRRLGVNGDSHQFRACLRQGLNLIGRGYCIRGVRIRHRLHDDRRVAADGHGANTNAHAVASRLR